MRFRKYFLSIFLVVLVSLSITTSVSPTFAGPDAVMQEDTSIQMNPYEQQVFDTINASRAANGLKPFRYQKALLHDARVRSVEASALWSHIRPNGSAWWTVDPDLMYSECLYYCAIDEQHPVSAADVVSAWLNSPSHRDQILNGGLKSMAVGAYLVNGKVYVAFEGGY